MKKISKEKLIELLKNKNNTSYNELASISGYHPKSLIRINKQIQNKSYNMKFSSKENMRQNIITNFLNSNYCTYKEYYKSKTFAYKISYSLLCKILNSTEIDNEIVIIKKIRNKNDNYFIIYDYLQKTLLFKFKSKKNDTKSVLEIIENLLNNYGFPKNICFSNFKINNKIKSILNNYKINILPYKTVYKYSPKTKDKINIKYTNKKINKDDFYNTVIRKTTATNVFQFNNIRYKVESNEKIKKRSSVLVYFNKDKSDIYIKYKNKSYIITPLKILKSKKGNSKYY